MIQGISLYKALILNSYTDDDDELITERILNWGESGGFKGVVIWDISDQITPTLGLPHAPSSRNLLVKDNQET